MSKVSIEQEIEMFIEITEKMNKIFACKRADYGQTSTETFEKFGPISMYVRMCDKMGRLENLMVRNQTARVCDEKVEDTLLDLANYCIITLIEMQKFNMNLTKACEEVNYGKTVYGERN
jgi:hypothetical protein